MFAGLPSAVGATDRLRRRSPEKRHHPRAQPSDAGFGQPIRPVWAHQMVNRGASADTMDVAQPDSRRFLHESGLTRHAVSVSVLVMLGTTVYLTLRYPSLPGLLPVHFSWDGHPNGWQFRTMPRVLLPLFVQLGIFSTGAAIGTLLLSRTDASTADSLPDAHAAVTATEAVMLICSIWVAFQAYAAYTLVSLWSDGGSTLGVGYTAFEVAGIVVSGLVGVRAQTQLAQPEPLPFFAAHWRLGQLYCNAHHPALFVPTRDGRRWTLNFGRPAAVVLLGVFLGVGVVAPTVMLALALR